MARGDVKMFANFDLKSKSGVSFNLTSDALKLAIVNSTTVPSVSTPDPRWGSGGSTDFSINQVLISTFYTGPIALTGVTWTRTAGVNTLSAANVVIPQDVSGFANGSYGIIYDSTVSGNYAIGYVDLGGPVSIQSGPLNINWNSAGIFTDTAS